LPVVVLFNSPANVSEHLLTLDLWSAQRANRPATALVFR
jgi:hypothetical protein